MIKNFFKLFLIILSVLVLGILLMQYGGKNIFLDLALYSYGVTGDNEPTPAVSQSVLSTPIPWEKLVAESALSSAGIQVFQENKLIRQGSGIIVSSDGLIVTTPDLAVAGGVFQVFHEDKVVRGSIVGIDYKANLMLVRAAASYSNVANLEVLADYKSGQEIILVGKLVDISKPTPFSQKGIVSYVTGKTIIIDSTPNKYLSGSTVVDAGGNLMGLIYLRSGKIILIGSDTIGNFLKTHLDKSNNK